MIRSCSKAARAARGRAVVLALVLAAACSLAGSEGASAQSGGAPAPRAAASAQSGGAPPPQPSAPLPYLQLAQSGVARAERAWRDARGGWYDERLADRDRYPLATIWGIVPLFEALNAIALAQPSGAHTAAVSSFARGAEAYFNASLKPAPGFAPYPHDRGQVRTWFDDNGWWGIAFMNAFQATGNARYVSDAQRAFAFIAAQGWDANGGGLWWNTSHPYKSGPALASASLLGALLYQRTHRAFYLAQVQRFISWGDQSLRSERGLYADSSQDSTPVPYVEGPMIEAHELLCRAGVQVACARAVELANAAWLRFGPALNMGPQFDSIYLHWMLVYASQTGDQRWRGLAESNAARAQQNALTGTGLYLRAWDGTPITSHQARPGMLQTDAATLSLFGWLAAVSQAGA